MNLEFIWEVVMHESMRLDYFIRILILFSKSCICAERLVFIHPIVDCFLRDFDFVFLRDEFLDLRLGIS